MPLPLPPTAVSYLASASTCASSAAGMQQANEPSLFKATAFHTWHTVSQSRHLCSSSADLQPAAVIRHCHADHQGSGIASLCLPLCQPLLQQHIRHR